MNPHSFSPTYKSEMESLSPIIDPKKITPSPTSANSNNNNNTTTTNNNNNNNNSSTVLMNKPRSEKVNVKIVMPYPGT